MDARHHGLLLEHGFRNLRSRALPEAWSRGSVLLIRIRYGQDVWLYREGIETRFVTCLRLALGIFAARAEAAPVTVGSPAAPCARPRPSRRSAACRSKTAAGLLGTVQIAAGSPGQ